MQQTTEEVTALKTTWDGNNSINFVFLFFLYGRDQNNTRREKTSQRKSMDAINCPNPNEPHHFHHILTGLLLGKAQQQSINKVPQLDSTCSARFHVVYDASQFDQR